MGFVKNITRKGLTDEMNASETKRIIMTNYVLLLASMLAFFRCFFFYFTGDIAYGHGSLLASILFLIFYYLNINGYTFYAKYFLMLTGNGIVLWKEITSGGHGDQLFLISASFSIAFLLFDNKEKWKLISALAVPGISLLIAVFLSRYIMGLDESVVIDKLMIEKFFGVLSAVIIIVFVTWYFVKRSGDAEAGLMETNNELKDLNFEISGQKDKIEELLLKSDKLLLNVLPEPIAERLKSGEELIADHFDEASIIFIDIADFAGLASRLKPDALVYELNNIFTSFDKISTKYGIEKIKTIGDCYMAAAGIPSYKNDHAESVAKMAVEAMALMDGYKTQDGQEIRLRVGIDCGSVVAGVIGERKFIYDLWGESVNRASRMEDFGVIGKIQCTENFRNKVMSSENHQSFVFIERGMTEIKGMESMATFFLESKV